MRRARQRLIAIGFVAMTVLTDPALAAAQTQLPQLPRVTIDLTGAKGPEQVGPAIKIILLLTILSIAPAILISVTSFVRIVIVLSFVRQAVGASGVVPTQVLMSLSLVLTAVVMTPVARRLDSEVINPYSQQKIDEGQGFQKAKEIINAFLVRQTRREDLALFYEITQTAAPARVEDVASHLLIPAFMISELRTGFEMGFLVFLPFVLIDLIVASLLTAMGMVMVPPTMISTPLKLLLFVVADGWALLCRSLVGSFT
jgi:flagellar biosynthesis protein FliP